MSSAIERMIEQNAFQRKLKTPLEEKEKYKHSHPLIKQYQYHLRAIRIIEQEAKTKGVKL